MRNLTHVLIVATITSLLAQSSSTYRVTHTYVLGGDGSWDYVVPDPPNHRLFIARQNRVMVVDEDNGTLLGEVTVSRARMEPQWLRQRDTASPPRVTTGPWCWLVSNGCTHAVMESTGSYWKPIFMCWKLV